MWSQTEHGIIVLLISTGLYAFLFPDGLINKMTDSYTVPDLIRGWGLYAVTLGFILYKSQYAKQILIMCFAVSILLHLNIIKKVVIHLIMLNQ
jgi:hypothetical protein